MELLLNLAWLLLVLPAYWLWRGSRRTRAEHNFSSLQCLLALGCVLVMLFPVISATDDLLAMRTEMEESPISKRSVRHASSDKSCAWNAGLETPPALVTTPASFVLAPERDDLPLSSSLSLAAAPAFLPAGRGPPASHLA
jgi:hypothetical protein